jgi:LAO/AO transport system kinase
MSLYERFQRGDRRALGRLISVIENRADGYREVLGKLATEPRHAYRIGITGPPGAGKSTLVDQVVAAYVAQGKRVAVIAVDPSSPFTGGALLGDRIRMQRLAKLGDVFIRSMASRGKSGGLAAATRDVMITLDAFGVDIIIVETVGIGQIELDIVDACDTVVVALVPESGDIIQTMKAGLMEIADIFCVNKIDREGGERLLTILQRVAHERLGPADREFAPVGTNAVAGDGIPELLSRLEEHRAYVQQTGLFEDRRRKQMRAEVLDIVKERIARYLKRHPDIAAALDRVSGELAAGHLDPYSAAEEILEQYFRGRLIHG